MCIKYNGSKHPSLFAWYFFNHTSRLARDSGIKLLMRVSKYKFEFNFTVEKVKYD